MADSPLGGHRLELLRRRRGSARFDAQQRALVRSMPFVRGSRLTLAIDNLFDQRLDVRDSMGAVPIGYQPDLLDPLGRSVRLEFRKLFF